MSIVAIATLGEQYRRTLENVLDKPDLEILVEKLLDEHTPEYYYYMNRRQAYCPTCKTSTEDFDAERVRGAACPVLDLVQAHIEDAVEYHKDERKEA